LVHNVAMCDRNQNMVQPALQLEII
jgi:hypothetical protein